MGVWLDEDIETIRTLWARGVPSRDIAAAMSRPVTRNAVMGKIDRLGIMGLGEPDARRLAAIAKVGELLQEPFSTGAPLHCQALLALLVEPVGRDVDALARASGLDRLTCAKFLERLPRVWSSSERAMPSRWTGCLEGTLSFILDMAVVSGSLTEAPRREIRPHMAA